MMFALGAGLNRSCVVDRQGKSGRRLLRGAACALLAIGMIAGQADFSRAAVGPQDPMEQARGLVEQAIALGREGKGQGRS